MGLLDSVMGALGGGKADGGGGQGDLAGMLGSMLGGGGQSNPILSAVLGMLAGGGNGGGLQDLIGRFQQNGLGEQVQSWIGSGQNLPISADQLQNVLGSEQIGAIAEKLGMSAQETSSQMAGVLPDILDRLTPDGQLPSGGLGDIGSMLQSILKGR
ncbi:MAG: YidB family protein [Lautropia sp.]